MKKLTSKLLTGILFLTTMCSGSLELITNAHAQSSERMDQHMESMRDELTQCCNDHEHEEKLAVGQSQEKITLRQKGHSGLPERRCRNIAGIKADSDYGAWTEGNPANTHLETIVMLE